MKLFASLSAVLVLLIGSSSVMGQSKDSTTTPSQACAEFVGQFYSWYIAKEAELVKANSRKSALDVSLSDKKSSFSPALVKALKEDFAAAKKSPGEIVGLDFDPILNAQDVAERYLLGKVTVKDDHYRVEVFGVWGGKKNKKPDVVPELVLEKGRWVFVNFYYVNAEHPVNANLLSVLEELKRQRQTGAK
jgi:Protein of unknown function (DUF3828)